jgi:simple sugar transport system ATP-binding protein/ribose transport system ATP-binding protein
LEDDSDTPSLELQNVSKHFGGVHALEEVSLAVARGSVHALVGENGAGKSTLGRVVAGVLSPDGGRLLLDGVPVSFRSPRSALEHGIAAVSQEAAIVPQLTVAENVCLGAEPRRAGFIERRALRRSYAKLAAAAGFELPAADAPAGRLGTAEQQKVEILRALARDARIIVMDEPTAALSAPETRQLHEIVRTLAASGKTILLISHFLREVLDLADTATVLRDGRIIRTSPTAVESEESLVEAMLGRPLTATFPDKQPPPDARVVLTVRNLLAPGVDDATLEVRAGEIVGLAGLVGAGRTELARAIFGASRVDGGRATLGAGGELGRSPRRSLRSGVAMIPESRKDHGLLFGRSVVENVTLPRLDELSRGGVVLRRAERKAAEKVLAQCDVRGARYSSPVRALSGGNQQKVLFARMMLCNPQMLIADEPTRGVDVGAKRAIYEFLASLAQQGVGVLLISSELEEILGLAHRVLVMRRGRIVAELGGEQMTEAAILAAAFADQSAGGVAAA